MRKALHILSEILIWTVIAVLALFLIYSIACRIKGESVRLFGLQADVVQSGSMEPTLYKNDLVFAKQVGEEELEIGDILVYKRGGVKYVHRLIEIDGESFVTQGDANNVADDPVSFSEIEGKVVATWKSVGGAVQFFQSVYGIIVLIAIIAAVFCFKKAIRILRTKKADDSSKGDGYEDKT